MCLTIPGKILAIDKNIATVKSTHRTAQIDLGLVSGAKVGSWLLYATDRAVKVISKKDAREIIELLEDHYNPVDISALPLKYKKIIYALRTGKKVTATEIEYLLTLKGKNNLEALYSEANTLRKNTLLDFVCIHGIIEFSNNCKNNCLYCGIRANNKHLNRYRMSANEIIDTAQKAVEGEGYKLLVLQSGEDESYADDELIKTIKKIKREMKVFIFLSVGERSESFYRRAFLAGASGSLFRFETSNPKLYAKMHPGHNLEERLDCLKYQHKLGYYIASGSIIGLPGQTASDIANDLLMIKKLKIPMISAGPYIQSTETPLFGRDKMTKSEKLRLTLNYIATARLLMPEIKIPVTTALETLDKKNGRHKGLLAGANALMFNLTPEKYCKKYSIYDNKFRDREKIWQKYGLFQGEESWEMLEEKLQIN